MSTKFRVFCVKAFPLTAALLLASPSLAQQSARIVDGDTLEIAGTMVRINGIDAPEAGQKCGSDRGQWPCGKEAVSAMAALVENKPITCDEHSRDRYGRSIATCYVDSMDIGRQLVQSGYAWAYVRFSDVYVTEEQEAREAKLGIWQGPALPAWEFRDTRWAWATESNPEEAPEGCPIKGNISKSGRIYHAPWSPWYSRTKINTAKGERWFCDELEAVEAGWRAPYWW